MDEQLKIAVTDLWTEMLRMACEHRLHSSEAGSVITVALRAYGEAQSQAQRERDAGQLERRASEIEVGQDAASVSAWLARILRDEAAAIRKGE